MQNNNLNNTADSNKEVNQVQNNLCENENLSESQQQIIKTYFSNLSQAQFDDIQKYLFFQCLIKFESLRYRLNEKGYEIKQCIEIGGESLIFDGIQKKSEQNIIIKVVPDDENENFKDQLEIIKLLQGSSKFVKFLECFDIKDEFYIFIMEKYQINLKQELIQMQHQGIFPEEKIIKIIFNLLHGVLDLHEKNILHLDLKVPNILLTNDGNYIISDFGVSQIKKEGKDITCASYTKIYSPIEQQLDEYNIEIDFKSDVFSLGVTFLRALDQFKLLKQHSQIISFVNSIEIIIRAYMTQQNKNYREDLYTIYNLFYKQFQKVKNVLQNENWFKQINEEIEFYHKKVQKLNQNDSLQASKSLQIQESLEEIADAWKNKNLIQ